MNHNLKQKNDCLGEILKKMGKVMVAFSGGVDSTLVLKRAQEELGNQVVAVIVDSELFRDFEFNAAVELAEGMGVQVYQTEIKELEDVNIIANQPNSWYYSKKLLYTNLNGLAEKMGYPYVVDGMIMDDKDDFRPGLKARSEAGVRSVLQEANLFKSEVRQLSKQLCLPVWDKPASCSLASRIPYGVKLDKQKIYQVDQAERFILKLGIEIVRVRYHNDLARIEIMPEEMSALMMHREKIQIKLTSLGFTNVALDLLGYRTGSMNEILLEDSFEIGVS